MGLLDSLLGGGGSSQNQGGGFFGSGASNSNTETNSNQTTQNAENGGINVNLSNLQFGRDEGFGAPVSSGRGSSSGSGLSVNNVSNVLDGGVIDSAFEFAEGSNDAVFNFGYDLLTDVNNIVSDVIVSNSENALSVINSAENFADLSAFQSLEFANKNAAIADSAINASALANNNITNLAYDSIREVGNAYGFANSSILDISDRAIDGVESLAYDSIGYLGAIQDDALSQISESTSAAQNASLKAIDYIFESSKTAEERTLTSATKWIIGGIVLMFAVPVLAGSFK